MPQIWTNRTLQGLIDIRRASNDLKHSIYGNRKVKYWQLVVAQLNSEYEVDFTYQQCRSRFNALVREFYDTVEFGNNVQGLKRNTAGTIFAAQLKDRFWERPPDRFDEMRVLSETAQSHHQIPGERGRVSARGRGRGRRGSVSERGRGRGRGDGGDNDDNDDGESNGGRGRGRGDGGGNDDNDDGESNGGRGRGRGDGGGNDDNDDGESNGGRGRGREDGGGNDDQESDSGNGREGNGEVGEIGCEKNPIAIDDDYNGEVGSENNPILIGNFDN